MAKQAESATKNTRKKRGKKVGVASPHTTEKERARLVEMVCELYESQHATIKSCCDACGITSRSFNLWCAQNSQFSDRYLKAKQRAQAHYWEELIVPAAESAFLRLLKGETKQETKQEGRIVNGTIITGKTTITKSEVLPHATVTIFAMKGLHPERFKEDGNTKIEVTFTDDASSDVGT